MKALVKLGTPAIAAATAVGLLAGTASAATTTVLREDTRTPYDGGYQILNVGALTFSGTGFTASCSSADLRGTLTSSGSGTLDSANVTGCTSNLGNPTVTFRNLPYTDGTLAYGPSGNYDGTLTFTDTDLEIQASFGFLTCVYGFDATHTSLTFQVRNSDNPANSTGQLAGTMNNVSLGLKSGSFLCPSGVTANGTGKALGKVNPSDTTYTQKLHITA
ncbi:hypothetical protein [Actinomadura rugatobispora]|uniref:Secreted protein n=1 Tax=Actinomadura rugatobispora TaxID=1994 RepID=A0ABW1A6S0_9ACTN|nr:hypothetical protein GCM10010200_013610 [Actinomadura rugatobispora]